VPAPRTPGTPYSGVWAKKHRYDLLLLNGSDWERCCYTMDRTVKCRVRMACEKLRVTMSKFMQDAAVLALAHHLPDDPDIVSDDTPVPDPRKPGHPPKKKETQKAAAQLPPPDQAPPETMSTEAINTDEDFSDIGFW
jgi:hypothetical protein